MLLPWTRRTAFPDAAPAELPPGAPPIFTVDVEEYFQVCAFERTIPRERWAQLPGRIEPQLELLLDLLGEHGSTGTFFVVGWIARRHPDLVRRIRALGHEVASHGHLHRRVADWAPADFRCEIRESRAVLEEVTGERVVGYRSPSFSITPGREWAFDILLEEGYRYDSSLFPIHRPGYGHPGALSCPFWIQRMAGQLLEIPMTTLRIAGLRLPAAGGAYFRHFPYALTRVALQRSRPGIFYIHPWELDPAQPRIAVPLLTRWRHYGGLRHTVQRLRQLLREFRFTSIANSFDLGGSAVALERSSVAVGP